MSSIKNAMTVNIPDIPWEQFIIGGVLFSLIKYASTKFKDIRIAGTIAAAPIGFMAILMVNKNKQTAYVKSYIISVCILILLYSLLWLLLTMKVNIYLAIIISLIGWIGISVFKIKFTT